MGKIQLHNEGKKAKTFCRVVSAKISRVSVRTISHTITFSHGKLRFSFLIRHDNAIMVLSRYAWNEAFPLREPGHPLSHTLIVLSFFPRLDRET